MRAGARRLPARLWSAFARRALLASCLWLVGAEVSLACLTMAHAAQRQVPGTTVSWPDSDPEYSVTAWYADLSDRYGHVVLGDGLEPTTLWVYSNANSPACGSHITLAPPHVFEDTAPRLADLDGDGLPEIITVRSHESKGAQLAVYALDPGDHTLSLQAVTPYIGTRFRWLAPLGAADLDDDGRMEIAYVDRPHLAKTLRVWRYENARLTEVASFAGVTNHRIGETDIAGGIRSCDGAPEMILADANWQSLLALRFDGAEITLRQIGIDTTRPAFAAAMACRD